MSSQQPTVNPQYLPPDMAEFICRRMRDISANINSCLIGQIYSFDSENQTAVVYVVFQKLIKGVLPLPSGDMADKVVNYPQLVNVPIMFLQGGSSYITMPIASGDTCLLLFCDRDMDTWFETGQIAPPNSDRLHNINDGIALVGIRNLQNSLPNYNPSIIQIVDQTGERLTQAGFLQAYAGSEAPSGWLLCYGQSISKTTYPILFAAIGYNYGGSGDNFSVPDLRGRMPVGLDNMGGSSANVLTNAFTPNRNVLGGSIGEQTHLLTGPESGIQTHNHGIPGTDSGAGFIPALNGARDNTVQSDYVPNTDALVAHYNVQPGRMFNWIIKI